MPRLFFLDSAKRDLAEIAAYIEGESLDRERATTKKLGLVAHCERLALLDTAMVRARPELRPA